MTQAGNSRVLILDDDAGILTLQRRALERAGYAVLEAGTAEQALQYIERDRPDIVILDYRLGGKITGLDFYHQLRESGHDLPAILVTGYSDEAKVIEALRAGLRDVVPKGGEYLEYLPVAVGRILRQVEAEHKALEAEALRQSQERLRELNADLEKRVAERTAEAQHRTVQLQRLAGELTRAEDRERRRLAQVLHDHLQQLLVGARFNMSIAEGQIDSPAVRQTLTQVDELLGQALEVSRSLTIELSPPILYEARMSHVLEWLARWMRQKHGLQVTVEADQQAEPQSDEVRVVIFQAVRELLFNVSKHAGVKQASVRLSRGRNQDIHVLVEDRGQGFDMSRLSGDGLSHTGFGLFGMRERIQLLNGGLEVQSVPGKGTQVHLRLPISLKETAGQSTITVVAAAPAQAAKDVPPAVSHEDGPASRKIRVLLADDHEVVRTGLARLLQLQPDVEVVGMAADGQQAVDMALQTRPDAVIMDVSMPQLSGIEATRRIHADLPEACVIGLSMHTEADMAAQMREAGAAAYLPKTCPCEQLIAAIHQCGMSSD